MCHCEVFNVRKATFGKKNQPISDGIMGWGDVSIWPNLPYD